MNKTNPVPRTGRPAQIPEHALAEIRRRAKVETWWGAQKVIALDLGLSCSYVNQVIRGHRRKERAA
jgi:hypothetical protein